MMSGVPPAEPETLDVTLAWIALVLSTLETAGPGIVKSYDPTTQTANIQPGTRTSVLQPDGTRVNEDPAVIPSVMVLFFRLGPFALTAPVNVGDTVLLIRCSADIGPWRAGNGQLANVGDVARHHNAHAIAIPGFYTRSQALANFSSNLRLGLDTSDGSGTIEITSAAQIILAGGTLKVARDTDPVDLGTFAFAPGTGGAALTWTPPGGSTPQTIGPSGTDLTGAIHGGNTKVLA